MTVLLRADGVGRLPMPDHPRSVAVVDYYYFAILIIFCDDKEYTYTLLLRVW